MSNMNIPVGISDFRRIREENYYYIDKSGLISTLLENTPAQVTLITRPRRFGKTLGMSMLANFFDISQDSRQLFKGLEISGRSSMIIISSCWMIQTFHLLKRKSSSVYSSRRPHSRIFKVLCLF